MGHPVDNPFIQLSTLSIAIFVNYKINYDIGTTVGKSIGLDPIAINLVKVHYLQAQKLRATHTTRPIYLQLSCLFT